MAKNISNEPNKDVLYTNEQFEEDLNKWVAETKYKNNSNNFIENINNKKYKDIINI